MEEVLPHNSENIKYDGIGTYVRNVDYERGIKIMTENKTELIKLILANDNLEKAIMTASVIILDFLKQHESYEGQASVCLGECGQTTPSS